MNILHARTSPDLLTRLRQMLASASRADIAGGYFYGRVRAHGGRERVVRREVANAIAACIMHSPHSALETGELPLLPDTEIQKELSEAYLRAVVFRAGLNLSHFENDRGIDGTIHFPRIPGKGVNRVDNQLKATTVYSPRNGVIAYDLDVKNYNLLTEDEGVPGVLILFIMPRNHQQWLAQSDEELCLRKCAYWTSLMGEPISGNISKKRVEVPLANRFGPDTIWDMFRQLV